MKTVAVVDVVGKLGKGTVSLEVEFLCLVASAIVFESTCYHHRRELA